VNLINRIVVTFALLALAAGAISIVVLAWTIPEDSIRGLRDAVDWLDENNEDLQKVLLTTIGAFLALVAFIALVLEFVPSSGPAVKVTDVQAGEALLTTAAIGQRVEEEVRGVANVTEVKAVVRGRRKGVEVMLDLHVDPQANLATVTNEACDAARRVLSDKVHVALAEQPRVRLHDRELRLQRALQPRPVEPQAPIEGPKPTVEAGPVAAEGQAESSAPPAEATPPTEDAVRADGA
jgi:hypothetical protein